MQRPAKQWTCDVCGRDGGVSANRPDRWRQGDGGLVADVCGDCAAKNADILNAMDKAREKQKKGKGGKGRDDEEPH